MTFCGDPRTTGITVKYRFPYPLAIGYAKLFTARDDQRRIEFLKKFAQDLMRYICYIQLADAVACGAPDKPVKKWFKSLAQPSEGKFRHVIAETTAFLQTQGSPFSPELQAFIHSGEWDRLIEPLHGFRRDDAHLRAGPGTTIAGVAEIEPAVAALGHQQLPSHPPRPDCLSKLTKHSHNKIQTKLKPALILDVRAGRCMGSQGLPSSRGDPDG